MSKVHSKMSEYIIVTNPKNLPISPPVSPTKRPTAMYIPKQQPYPTTMRKKKLYAESALRTHCHQQKDFHTSKRERATSYPRTTEYVKSSRHQIIQPGVLRRDMHRHF